MTMTNREVEIIGGPEDGKVIAVADGVSSIAFIVRSDRYDAAADDEPTVIMPMTVQVPIRRRRQRFVARWEDRSPR